MSAGFDEICRVIASPVSRRTAIRTVVGIAAGGLFAFSPRRVLAAGPCQQFDKAEGCPGMNLCGEDPHRLDGILCCPAGTRCCYNFARERCECCVGVEFCCQDAGGVDSGICCHAAASCCANAAGVTRACCDALEECCNNLDGTSSGVCCDTGNGSCCRNPVTGIAHACCRNDPRQVCCPEGFCCDSAVREPDVCCETLCCAPTWKCCEPRRLCCAPEKECCTSLAALGAGISRCCEKGEKCCEGPGGIPVDCCKPDELCLAGVCARPAILAYNGRGSAKAVLADGSVSIIRFEIAGTGVPIPPDSFGDTDNISGSLQAFNYATRTLIDSVRYSGVQGRRSADGDVFIVATGSARANGRPINIVLIATNADGVITFDIRNRDTGAFLAGGTGETGRADLRLTVT